MRSMPRRRSGVRGMGLANPPLPGGDHRLGLPPCFHYRRRPWRRGRRASDSGASRPRRPTPPAPAPPVPAPPVPAPPAPAPPAPAPPAPAPPAPAPPAPAPPAPAPLAHGLRTPGSGGERDRSSKRRRRRLHRPGCGLRAHPLGTLRAAHPAMHRIEGRVRFGRNGTHTPLFAPSLAPPGPRLGPAGDGPAGDCPPCPSC